MNWKLIVMVLACVLGPLTATADEPPRFEVTGTGEVATHHCEPGTEVEVSGASNTVTLTGQCRKVTVEGSSNTVKVDGVFSITVTGTANTVTWKYALGKSNQPRVRRTGVNNKVTQQE